MFTINVHAMLEWILLLLTYEPRVSVTYLLRTSSVCLTYRSSTFAYAVIFMDTQNVGPLGRISTYITVR